MLNTLVPETEFFDPLSTLKNVVASATFPDVSDVALAYHLIFSPRTIPSTGIFHPQENSSSI
ncbi:hypothetical protein ACKGJO_13880 [Gracilimonas sp. Q87]|uniref:hypothetical protein n=1 Tax=Gracilimonas sp. Q87 TaxID=3384766 RepID=UPI0039840C2A